MALDPQERPQPVRSPSKGVVSYVKEGLREGTFVEQGELVLRLTPFAADGVSQLETQIVATESRSLLHCRRLRLPSRQQICKRVVG